MTINLHIQQFSNQRFDKQISRHQKGGGSVGGGNGLEKATAYKFVTCTLIGSTEK